MNGTERAFAMILETLKRAGLLEDYRFESVTLRLPDHPSYTPDFMLTWPDCIEFAEIKGSYVRDHGRLRYRVAVDLYPEFLWSFREARYTCRKVVGWKVETSTDEGDRVAVELDRMRGGRSISGPVVVAGGPPG